MKRLFLLISIFLSYTALAQDENEYKTIFGGHESGGYGSFSLGYTLLDTTHAMVFNARGGVILGHTLAMGLGGSGFVSEYTYDSRLELKSSLSGGYGGVFLELILLGNSPVHLSIPCLFGVGGAAYSTWTNEGTDYEKVNDIEDVTTFLVIEPGVELEFNLTKFFRIAGFFNYRFTSDLDLTSVNPTGGNYRLVNPEALNSYSAGIIFKFGKF
jgi:hypothetical protein